MFQYFHFVYAEDKRDSKLLCNYPGIIKQRLSYSTPEDTLLQRHFIVKEKAEEKYLWSSTNFFNNTSLNINLRINLRYVRHNVPISLYKVSQNE